MRMELIDLMQKISRNDIPHFLILFGEEQKIIDIYINNICDKIQAKKVVKESVSSVVKNIGKKSIDKCKKLYIVTEDIAFTKLEDNWESVKNAINKDYVILRYNSLDKRSAFIKKNQQNSHRTNT